jgi:hypothetical protein
MESSMFLKNTRRETQSNVDNPYLGSLTIFVWVMPVSILLFAIGVSEQLFSLAFAALFSLSVSGSYLMFLHQQGKRLIRSVAARTAL